MLALGKLGGREMTATSDLDLILHLRFRCRASGVRRRAPAPRRAVFRPPDPAADQRVDDADAITACSTTSTCGCGRRAAPARWRRSSTPSPSYQDDRGLDLGAHGADARAGGLGVAGLSARGSRRSIRDVLRRPRDAAAIAGDVVEMRRAIAQEKGEDDRWDLKYAAGGLVDIEFIAQYLQLVHAAEHARHPRHLDRAGARQRRAARRAAGRGRRGAAAGGRGSITT